MGVVASDGLLHQSGQIDLVDELAQQAPGLQQH